MTQKTSFIFGLFFFASGIFLWQAQAYTVARNTWQNRPTRTFSARYGSYRHTIPTRKQLNYNTVAFTHPSMRGNTHLHSQYRESTLPTRDQRLLRRIKNPELYPRYMNELQSQVYVVRGENYSVVQGLPFTAEQNIYLYDQKREQRLIAAEEKNITSRVNDSWRLSQERRTLQSSYTFTPPTGFEKQGRDTYRHDSYSFAFRIQEDNSTVCHKQSATECAVNKRKSFVDDQGISVTSSIKRMVWNHQGYARSFTTIPSITEAFYASTYGNEYLYFIFTIMHPETGRVLHIEAVSDISEKDISAQIMKHIIESFQFL